ncbi:ATP-binding protein [Streptomyces sp. WM6378]|uniref:ATP-binding protein n=1 Tax=Streptomyces sp. WM6378 TaxID=1415557 RepID=UPI0006AF459F|nr:NB-ARC domain-containing protein [Streptomyces sp. WM6378]
MEAELAALAGTAATTLMGLMVSESWTQARARVARFFARRGGAGAAEDELPDAPDELTAAAGADDAAAVEGELRRRLRRMLEEDPGAAQELRILLAELTGAAGSAPEGRAAPGRHAGIAARGQLPSGDRPDEVPALRTRFINRTDTLSALDGILATGASEAVHVGVLVVAGPPGVGKKATVRHCAHRSRAYFPDGQVYVDFAELRGRAGGADVSAALGMCLRSLGVKEDYLPRTLPEQTRLLRERTGGRRLLFVLDNVDAPAQVRALVPNGPGSAVLVTSSTSLGELAMDGARLMSLKPLGTHSALALLADRCGQEAVDADRAAAERLVELCGGLPVALHVVAARLLTQRRLTTAALAAELSDENRRLSAMSLRGEHPVSAVFDASYRQLEPEAARCYRLLSWIPGRTFETGTVAAALGTDRVAAGSLLDELVEASLLEEAGEDRYRCHELVRLHARERAESEEPQGSQLAVVERVLTHYLTLTAFADRAVRLDRLRIADLAELLADNPDPFAADDAPDPLDWLEAERANILAVLRAAGDHGLCMRGWQLAEGFTVLFLHRRYVADWKESLELGAAFASAALEPAAEARLRSLLSRPLMDLGEYERARAELNTAQACAEVADHTQLRASVLEFLGRYWDRSDPARAIEVYEESVRLNAEAGQARGAAIVTFFLGCAQDAVGDSALALDTLRQAHQALLGLADPDVRMAARATDAIGRAHGHLGQRAEAERELREAVRVLREQGATHYEAQALLELADIARREGGDRTHLRADLTRALEIHEAGGSPLAEEIRARLGELG